jgi:tetratricopeptide (TPR) repeat protein
MSSLVSTLRWSAIGVALLGALGGTAIAAPYHPDSPAAVLLELGDNVRSVTRSRDQLQSGSAAADPTSAAKLAGDFIGLGRTQNDERYFGYASAILRPWRTVAHPPVEIAILSANIAQHQHRFTDALIILNDLLHRDSQNVQARLMRASLLMTQGQPQQAQRDCQQLLSLGETFVATICIAQAASLTGNLAASYQLLSTLLERAATDRSDQYAWGLGIAGEMAERKGDLDAAARWFLKAIEMAPSDLVSRLQLADIYLQRGAYQPVLTLLKTAPPSEPVLLRRALAARFQDHGSATAALSVWQTAATQSSQLGVRLHLRELARGELELLDKPQLALATALENWQVQREPSDARILVAAARACHDSAALNKVTQWRRDLKLEDEGLLL